MHSMVQSHSAVAEWRHKISLLWNHWRGKTLTVQVHFSALFVIGGAAERLISLTGFKGWGRYYFIFLFSINDPPEETKTTLLSSSDSSHTILTAHKYRHLSTWSCFNILKTMLPCSTNDELRSKFFSSLRQNYWYSFYNYIHKVWRVQRIKQS